VDCRFPLAVKKAVVQVGVFDCGGSGHFPKFVDLGSGSLISAEGHVLTANHVLRKYVATNKDHKVLIGMYQSDEEHANWSFVCSAESIVADPQADIACLKITSQLQIPQTFRYGNPQAYVDLSTQIRQTPAQLQLPSEYLPVSLDAGIKTGVMVQTYGWPYKKSGEWTQVVGRKVANVTALAVNIDMVHTATSGYSGAPLTENHCVIAIMSFDNHRSFLKQQCLQKNVAPSDSIFSRLRCIPQAHPLHAILAACSTGSTFVAHARVNIDAGSEAGATIAAIKAEIASGDCSRAFELGRLTRL
jgi:hypothetical protein